MYYVSVVLTSSNLKDSSDDESSLENEKNSNYKNNNNNNNNNNSSKEKLQNTKVGNNNIRAMQVSIDEQWMQRFMELKDYQKEYGTSNVDAALQSKFSALAKWVLNQKEQLSKLTDEQIEMLKSIGCSWTQMQTTQNKQVQSESIWDECIAQLKEFRRTHGHVNVPRRPHEVLANWIDNVRLLKKWNRLQKAQLKQLKAAGFVWSKWHAQFEALKVFVQKNGHCNVPPSHSLYKWVQQQKKAKDKRADRYVLLNSVGFTFAESDDEWSKSALFDDDTI